MNRRQTINEQKANRLISLLNIQSQTRAGFDWSYEPAIFFSELKLKLFSDFPVHFPQLQAIEL